jgi:hypothetical protein
MKCSHSISFAVDTLIVECLLSDERFVKNAQGTSIISDLAGGIKRYVANKIDSGDVTGSLLNILAPGAIATILSFLGFGWLGWLIALSMRIFHIDVKAIWTSIHNKVKGLISGGNKASSADIDSAVQSAVQDNTKPATEEDVEAAQKSLGTESSLKMLQEARMLKLAMIEYRDMAKTKTAGPASALLSAFSGRKAMTTSLLGKVLGWIFKIALAAAGLMVTGDVVNKVLDRPNALDGSVQKGKPVGETAAPAVPVAPPMPKTTQTKFKVKSGYQNTPKNTSATNWVENVRNDESSIEQMLVDFTKEVYDGVDNLDSVIRGTAGFQAIADKIVFYNQAAKGNSLVFIPKMFVTKKQIVDYFIDDVAENAK